MVSKKNSVTLFIILILCISTMSIFAASVENVSISVVNDNLTCNYDLNSSVRSHSVAWERDGVPVTGVYFPAEGGITEALKDRSGNGIDLTNQGAVQSFNTGFDGNGSFYFDGINDRVYTSANSILEPTENITISLWMRRDGAQTAYAKLLIYGQNTLDPFGPYSIEFSADLDTDVGLHIGNINFGAAYTTSAPITNNVWHHIVGTYNGSTVSIYVNGVFENSATFAQGIGDYNNVGLSIGGDNENSDYYKGFIDDVRIYTHVISDEQITALYNNRPDLIVSQELTTGETYSCNVSSYYTTSYVESVVSANYTLEQITIETPENNSNLDNLSLPYLVKYSLREPGDACWYSIDGGATNITINGCGYFNYNVSNTYTIYSNLTDGSVFDNSVVANHDPTITYNWTNLNDSLLSGDNPHVFDLDSSKYLLMGRNDGTLDGYIWNVSQWNPNTAIESGLTDVGSASYPTTFYIDDTLHMIVGDDDGFNGYTWTGSTWTSNSTMVSGLSAPLTNKNYAPEVFELENGLNLLSGYFDAGFDGVIDGYSWNGSTWVSNTSLETNLVEFFAGTQLRFFDYKGVDYLFVDGLQFNSDLDAYAWNGSTWVVRSDIFDGLNNDYDFVPSTYEIDGTYYALMGQQSSGPYGDNVSLNQLTFYDPQMPVVNITYPLNTSYKGLATPTTINYTVVDNNIDYCEYSINGTANVTLASCQNVSGLSFGIGTHDIVVYATDIYNNTASDSVSFTVEECFEEWRLVDNACQINNSKFIEYYDLNNCGPTTLLPANNGTWQSCTYCAPEWIANSSILQCEEGMNTYDVLYYDLNECYEKTGNSTYLDSKPAESNEVLCNNVDDGIWILVFPIILALVIAGCSFLIFIFTAEHMTFRFILIAFIEMCFIFGAAYANDLVRNLTINVSILGILNLFYWFSILCLSTSVLYFLVYLMRKTGEKTKNPKFKT